MKSVDIIICYRQGTSAILKLCLDAIEKHTAYSSYKIFVVYNELFDYLDVDPMAFPNVEFKSVLVPTEGISESIVHGLMLDEAMCYVLSDYILTLDSDCFPIASGWLTDLVDAKATIAGISQPWIPPDDSVEPNTIEYRIRSQLNWDNTHVACQLVSTRFIIANDLKYSQGDDTGFTITKKAREIGALICAIKPTRCPKSDNPAFDPEFNRELSVVFGDKIYHHGSYSRGIFLHYGEFFETARKRVEAKGAEWLLKEGHEYRFDMEDEVAEAKMNVMYDMMKQYLLTHDSLFGE